MSVYMPGKKKDKLEIIEQQVNELGKIPAVFVYAQRSATKGVGISDIGDIADMQNLIHNQLSELEQIIRLSNAPSLVKTQDTDAAAGAGAIITIPNELDGALRPYLLQPNAQSLEGILQTIDSNIKSIDRMAHMGALRAIETRQMSGAAMAAEFTMLDSKLSEKAKNLETAEEQIWRLWSEWQGESFDGEIIYPDTFHIRDKAMDMELLEKAARTNPANPQVKAAIDAKILELIQDDGEEMQHPVTTPANRTEHIKEMVMQGFTDQQMLDLHPEITQADIDTAKQDLLNQG